MLLIIQTIHFRSKNTSTYWHMIYMACFQTDEGSNQEVLW